MGEAAAKRRDRRAEWDESPELRRSVRDDLYEWGGAQRGDLPNLGYPTLDGTFAQDDSRVQTYDADKVQAIDDTFTLWNLIIKHTGDSVARQTFKRERSVLKHYFIGQGPVEAAAEKMGIGKTTFYRSLDTAMYRFWRLHY